MLLGLVGKYGWTLWGAIQAAVSPIDFDFWSWGMERFDGAVAGFTAAWVWPAARRGSSGMTELCSGGRAHSRVRGLATPSPPGRLASLSPGGAVAADQIAASRTLDLPRRAQVVIIGGGVIGTSVAYHLTKRGLTDVLLLEQGQLSCGTTWHAAGLVGQLRASESGTRLVQYSTALYDRLEAETGLATGFRRCGGVTVARTQGPADGAAADGGHGRGVRARLRADQSGPGGRAVPDHGRPPTWSARSGCPATAGPTRPT